MFFLMKRAVFFIVLSFSSFSTLADAFSEWKKNLLGISMTRGTALDGSGKFARASIGHLPANNDYGKEPYTYVTFSFQSADDVAECKANPNKSLLRKKLDKVNEKTMEFELYCSRMAGFEPSNPMIEILYVVPNSADMSALKEIFFRSNYVTFNGFKFPANGFTKTFKQYKSDNNL